MKALLVVDLQNVCVGEKHAKFFHYDCEKLIKEANRVIGENSNHLIIYIRNIMKRNLINMFAPFHAYENSIEIELVKDLDIVSEYIFDKYKADAFSNENLVELLKENNVDEIELIGVDGGGCVGMTAIGAVNRGYKVVVNETAIGTKYKRNRDKLYAKLKEKGATFVSK